MDRAEFERSAMVTRCNDLARRLGLPLLTKAEIDRLYLLTKVEIDRIYLRSLATAQAGRNQAEMRRRGMI